MSESAERFLESVAFDPSDAGRRARYGSRLRRAREERGLNQREAAEGSGVSQSALARAERGQAVDEEALVALERFYGLRDAYPSAPKDPVRRIEWFAARIASMQVRPPASGIFGQGKPPGGAA